MRLRSDEPWTPTVPEGWEPVAAVCRAVRDDLPSLTERILYAIRREVSSRPARPPAPEQLYADVFNNLDMILFGIAERREPAPEELEVRGELGRRDANNGMPLQSVMASYHVGFREHWAALVAESQRQGGEAPGKILIASANLWDWTYAMMNVVAAEYGRVVAERQAAEALAHAHFIDLLVRDPASEDCAAIARGLGFDTDGAFLALAFPASATQGLDARLRAAVAERGVTATFGARGRTILAIVQGVHADDLDAILDSASGGEAVGVGLSRSGLPGARASVTDAERALELGETRGSIVRFADAWLPATVLALRATLAPVLDHGAAVAAANPHLAEAVRAFAASDFSLAEGARRLVLSETSLRHRLTRWKTLTGWDPWTLDGMSASMFSLDLQRRAPGIS